MPETETPPRILQGDLSRPIPSHTTSPCTSLFCNPSLSYSFSHKLLTHELFILHPSLQKQQQNSPSVSCDHKLWAATPFFPLPSLLFTSLPYLKSTWALSKHWMSGPRVEVGAFLAPHCYFQIIKPFPSCKNHSSFNADVICICHCFLVLLLFCQLPSHISSFTSLLFLARGFPFHQVSFLYPWRF